jgi:threonine dehydrogenase-like Zn-dependent dehydrogenase
MDKKCSCGAVNDNLPCRHCKKCHAAGVAKERARKKAYTQWLEGLASSYLNVPRGTLKSIWDKAVLSDPALKKHE